MHNKKIILLFPVPILLICAYAVLPGECLFGLEWVWLFAFGYAYARISTAHRHLIAGLSFAVLLFCLWCIHGDHSILLSNFNRCNRIFHCSLGIFLFCTALFTCTTRPPKWIFCLDCYSYEIYLVHFVFLIGPGTVLGVTGSTIGDIILILLLSIVMALFLKYTSRAIVGISQ